MAEDKPTKRAHNFKDITGQKFGRLTAISFAGRVQRISLWLCVCDCPKKTVVTVRLGDLTRMDGENISSCGCFRIDRIKEVFTTHGRTHTREYRKWGDAKTRCFNPKNSHFESYGGRGITMCQRWDDSFEAFYEDMGDCPKGMTLERIDVNGDYEPSNCKWATLKDQARNKRNSVMLTYAGVNRPLCEWAELTNISYSTLKQRIAKGKDPFQPLRGASRS